MIENIYLIIGYSIIADMIAVRFEPIQSGKQKLLRFFEVFPSFISTSLNKLFNCSRCLSFWIVLFIYVDIVMAAIAGFVGFLINHIHDRIQAWYE